MNRHQLTQILNLATLLLLTAVPGIAYVLWTSEPPMPATPRESEALEPVLIPKAVLSDFAPYYARYMFQVPEPPQTMKVVSQDPPAQLAVNPPNFQVIAMVHSSDMNRSLITIRQGNSTTVLPVGDQSEGYLFEAIDPAGRAVFRKQDRTFFLEVIE